MKVSSIPHHRNAGTLASSSRTHSSKPENKRKRSELMITYCTCANVNHSEVICASHLAKLIRTSTSLNRNASRYLASHDMPSHQPTPLTLTCWLNRIEWTFLKLLLFPDPVMRYLLKGKKNRNENHLFFFFLHLSKKVITHHRSCSL